MASITLKNLKKVYDNQVLAVSDFSMEIQDQEFIVLVGPSGCGKSTILRMIAGLEEISGGELYIGRQKMNDVPPRDRDIAMVFQNYALYPHMTAYKNMAFGLENHKLPKEQIDAKVREAARILDIEDLLDRKPKAMSGGQRQRVALGRAMVREPAVFLLDEPLSNLDAKLRTSMRSEIIKLHQRLGTTFVYVTHDQIEAMTMGDRIVVMKDGVIQQIGTPAEVYHRPANLFVAGFIGTPPMNFIDGTLERQGDVYLCRTACGTLRIPAERILERELTSGQVVLGIRPHNLHLAEDGAENCLRLSLDYVEHLGKDLLLKCYYGEAKGVRVLSGLNSRIHLNDAVTVRADIEAISVFDQGSGENITRFESGGAHAAKH